MKKILKFITNLLSVIALVVLMVPLSSVSAQSSDCDVDFYASNDIFYYDPCYKSCSATQATSVVTASSLSGSNNAEKIYNFWIASGLTPQQSAGVLGSMKHEGGFSPFRQEDAFPWPEMGYGIAQFTHDPGQRGEVKKHMIQDLGQDLFDSYYKADYGGPVLESKGYIPDGVPEDVNDRFLLSQLNFLLKYTQSVKPNNTRKEGYLTDFGVSVSSNHTIYDHIKTINTPGEAAVAWTYLYEWPGNIKSTSLERSSSADQLAKVLNSAGSVSASCGGLVSGGMNLEQAKEFMRTYKLIDSGDPNSDKQYLSPACNTLTDNCVTFSSYFVQKYTTAKFGVNNGAMVVNSTLAVNPGLQDGKLPKPYALFGTKKGETMCDWNGDGSKEAPCGHTGIILGVDTSKGVVIVGEAAYCNDGFTAANEYPLDTWSDGSYQYAYLEQYLKPSIMGG